MLFSDLKKQIESKITSIEQSIVEEINEIEEQTQHEFLTFLNRLSNIKSEFGHLKTLKNDDKIDSSEIFSKANMFKKQALGLHQNFIKFKQQIDILSDTELFLVADRNEILTSLLVEQKNTHKSHHNSINLSTTFSEDQIKIEIDENIETYEPKQTRYLANENHDKSKTLFRSTLLNTNKESILGKIQKKLSHMKSSFVEPEKVQFPSNMKFATSIFSERSNFQSPPSFGKSQHFDESNSLEQHSERKDTIEYHVKELESAPQIKQSPPVQNKIKSFRPLNIISKIKIEKKDLIKDIFSEDENINHVKKEELNQKPRELSKKEIDISQNSEKTVKITNLQIDSTKFRKIIYSYINSNLEVKRFNFKNNTFLINPFRHLLEIFSRESPKKYVIDLSKNTFQEEWPEKMNQIEELQTRNITVLV